MTIQEILEAHRVIQVPTPKNFLGCACGMDFFSEIRTEEEFHRAHVAEVLDKHMQERMAHERAHTIQMIRDQSDWTQDESDEYGRVTLEGYLTIGTRELDEIEDGAGADRMCFSLADWEKREEQVRAEAKAEALRGAADDLFDWTESPFMCLDECGNSNCPDDIRLGAGKDIQKWLRARANQYRVGSE